MVTPALRRYLVALWHATPEKIAAVENRQESELFHPQEKTAFLGVPCLRVRQQISLSAALG